MNKLTTHRQLVDMDTMLIVEKHISQKPNDKQEIKPTLENLGALPDDLGTVDSIVADTGYFSEENVESCEQERITPYISTKRDEHNQQLKERFCDPESLPDNADPVTRMKLRLKTPEGKRLYGKHKCTVEPVFGIVKAVMGVQQFMLRGLESVSGEWDLEGKGNRDNGA